MKSLELRKSAASALLTLFVLASAVVTLSACNTTRGVGEDLGAAGNALSNTATQTKERL